MIAVRRRPSVLIGDRRGAAVIELAIVLPVLVVLMFGIVTYGSWIALSHAVQQGANEAARGALPGLTPDERATLARAIAQTALRRSWRIEPAQMAVSIADDGATLTVDVTYDASANPLLKLPLIPLPSTTIERRAAVRLTSL